MRREQVCDGLLPLREIYSYSAFLLFALSGLTRSSVDYFILIPRLPVVVLATIILWFLQFHGTSSAKRFFRLALIGDGILLIMVVTTHLGYRVDHAAIRMVIDSALAAVSLLLFYGKQMQAVTMYREQRSHAVSWLREIGVFLKDVTGLWYTLLVGSELVWLALTHALSIVASVTICGVKFMIERIHAISAVTKSEEAIPSLLSNGINQERSFL